MLEDRDFEDPDAYQGEEEYQPWYKAETSTPPPFQLVRKITLDDDKAPSFQTVAMFPWDVDSLSELWKGNLATTENLEQWKHVISEYWDTVAVGSEHTLYIFFTNQKRAPLVIKLLQDSQKLISADRTCVAWGMTHDSLQPLVIFSRGSLVFIYNIVMGLSGYLRGHGGAITSISVHPTQPNLFCTTSRDFTTRIYDLLLSASLTGDDEEPIKTKKSKAGSVPNPHWPPGKHPSLAGAAHGLRLPASEPEGRGRGRCIVVLMGGRSAGHQAAVLGAAFHPEHPIIATCGMDRTVKIWPVRPTSMQQIKREDKPLFSSGMLHKSRVLSVAWLQHDLLLTHSAPAIMRVSPDSKKDKETYLEAGELIIWRWLSVDRFFPTGYEDNPDSLRGLRGCSSDYQESSSFKLLSIHAFPAKPTQYIAPNLSLFQTPIHDPLIVYVYPGEYSICMLNAANMSPRKKPPFPSVAAKLLGNPEDANGAALADAAGRLHLTREEEGGEEEEEEEGPIILRRPTVVPPGIDCWTIDINDEDPAKTLTSCAMGMGGRVVVGVGSKGTLWVWRYDD
ncbi:hypothetical protein GALMADRAFT_233399 [Galerina marginata CBS 339.88]|uniref:Uncharacterized protein n=1 Tax=Galerina marginata (strain CBS 339.88) TaxID=685588 RepID=A0A067U0S9_GALM3|nr:hypothetical protein GALMADRAFT_233399 [Galerina marginata CBS 339.88]